jgi:hypothetical protein
LTFNEAITFSPKLLYKTRPYLCDGYYKKRVFGFHIIFTFPAAELKIAETTPT